MEKDSLQYTPKSASIGLTSKMKSLNNMWKMQVDLKRKMQVGDTREYYHPFFPIN